MKTLIVDSNDVMIIDILDNSMGVSFLTYIILNGDEILDGNSLLAAIQVYDGKSVEKSFIQCSYIFTFLQNGSDIYKRYNFRSMIAEKFTSVETGNNQKKGVSGGAIAGIVIFVLLLVAAVVVIAIIAAFIM